MKSRAVRWGIWLLGVAVCAWVVARTTIVTDITAFLPGPATREQALLAEQLRDGVAARVILMGIEAASAESAPAAARRSLEMAQALRADARFAFVANGDPDAFAAERDRLLGARYLISEQVTPQRFSVDALRSSADDVEAMLRSSAAPLFTPIAARDLTGELLALITQLKPARSPNVAHGVWFDATGRTALLLATTRAPGFDVDRQAEALAAVRAAFAAKGGDNETLTLHLSGPGVFAVQSRQAIESDARRLTVLASIAVALLLLVVLRSPRFLLWAALPTATGALAGLAAVSTVFGSVHGVTLGFGLTLVGEAVDYAVYVQVQRQSESTTFLWRGEKNTGLWRGLWLAMLTSSAGFVAMMLSGFAGLMQLGLMSIVGIVVAAAIARFLLPDVLRPLDPAVLSRWAPWALSIHAPRARLAVLAIAAAALMLLVSRGDRLWNDQLSAISPLAPGAGETDARLRSSIGLGDLRFVIAVEGETADQALSRAEALHDRLRRLKSSAAIVDFDSPATLVPSSATQAARRAALPDEATLRGRLAQAMGGSALRAAAFEPFIADVQRARELVITPDYYAGTALGQRLSAQLVERAPASHAALITLTGVNDAAAVAAAVSGEAGVSLIDLTDVQKLVANYRVRAVWAALGGGLLIVLILAVQLRNAAATARISLAVAVSVLITSAALVLIEGALTLFHLVALLLAAGVGSNYAVFLGMPRDDAASQPSSNAVSGPLPVIVSITLAAATTLVAFAALSFSVTPVLHMIGITVAIGGPVALAVSMALAAPPRGRASA